MRDANADQGLHFAICPSPNDENRLNFRKGFFPPFPKIL
jgi:hypothetical protein